MVGVFLHARRDGGVGKGRAIRDRPPLSELLGEVAKRTTGDEGKALRAAHEEVEEREDEHVYHTTGWGRELWIDSLGLPLCCLPPRSRRT